MLTQEIAYSLAKNWIAAWNAHDLNKIMSHYDEQVVLVSPIAAKILDESSGMVKGKEALRAYFQKGLEVYPNLNFELLEVMWGISSVVLYYTNQKGTKSGELMEISAAGLVTKVIAHYND